MIQRSGGCPAWPGSPLASKNASSFAAAAAAKVVYRSPPPRIHSQPRTRTTTQCPAPTAVECLLQEAVAVSNRGRRWLRRCIRRQAFARQCVPVIRLCPPWRIRVAPAEPCLYLRTGDAIPCEVERIDQRGVTFHSPSFRGHVCQSRQDQGRRAWRIGVWRPRSSPVQPGPADYASADAERQSADPFDPLRFTAIISACSSSWKWTTKRLPSKYGLDTRKIPRETR